jgi:hypothetical protein
VYALLVLAAVLAVKVPLNNMVVVGVEPSIKMILLFLVEAPTQWLLGLVVLLGTMAAIVHLMRP